MGYMVMYIRMLVDVKKSDVKVFSTIDHDTFVASFKVESLADLQSLHASIRSYYQYDAIKYYVKDIDNKYKKCENVYHYFLQ
jgi:hypothetical protein